MISIFTPTYNRKECLKKLAESLLLQTNKDFEWIIVDDGSIDETEEVIKQYTKQIKITYIYQQNAGKHIAYNRGIELAKGDLFVCVDSDDVLQPNAIEVYSNTYDEKEQCIGYIFPRCYSKGDDSKKWSKINNRMIDVVDLKFLYDIRESDIAIKINILRKYRFPVFYKENKSIEKFCPEELFYYYLAKEGKFKVIDKTVYISEYLEGGLTSKIFRLWIENSEGVLSTLRSRYIMVSRYQFSKRILNQIKCILNVNALCIVTKKSILNHTPSKLWSIVLLLPSVLFKIKRYGRMEKKGNK